MKTAKTILALALTSAVAVMAQEGGAAAGADAAERPVRQWQRNEGAAQGRMMGAGGGFDQNTLLLRLFNDEEMANALKLSDEQKATMKKAATELDERQNKVNEELRLASLEQAALAAKIMADKEADTDELMALVEKLGGLRTEQAKIQTERLLVIRDVLAAEQLRAASEQARKRMERIRERMEQRPTDMQRDGGAQRGNRDGVQRGEQRGNRDGAQAQRGNRRDGAQRGADRRDNRPLPQRPAGWDE